MTSDQRDLYEALDLSLKPYPPPPPALLSTCSGRCTVRAKIITNLMLERAGPVIFKNCYWNKKSVETDPSNLSCKKSKA